MRCEHRVVYTHPGGSGWSTVELMARLLARVIGADLVELDGRSRSYPVRRYLAGVPRRRGRGHCIVVAPQPVHLSSVMSSRHVLGGYATVSGWVIDSFWDDRIPAIARGRGHFDHLFVTDRELVDTWAQRTSSPATWLPFGSDVLDSTRPPAVRLVDLLRVGRQPPAWEDDLATTEAARRHGLVFAGRAPGHTDPSANQASLLGAMRDARLTLSFSNLVSPDVYTHPTRDYLTGRWTDALASGCVVAGVAPRTGTATALLWDTATTPVDPDDREAGLEQVASAVRRWTPDVADLNRRTALGRLDWRLRFRDLALTTGLSAPTLDDELGRLELALDDPGWTR